MDASRSSARRTTTTSFLLMLTATAALAAGKPAVPDLAAGGTPDNKSDWTLGSTGARGWICEKGSHPRSSILPENVLGDLAERR